MRVMVIVKATKDSEAGVMPSEQLLTEMGKYNEQLVAAGIMLAGEGLHPSSSGVRVRFEDDKRTVTRGPFAHTNELVAGYWLWQVKSMEDAIEWVKRCPNPMNEASEIEIRRVFTAEDFGDAFTSELRESEERMTADIEKYVLDPPRFVQHGPMDMVGVNATYTFENRHNIPSQWQRFVSQMQSIPGRMGGSSYGVCWNYVAGKGFDYLTCVQVEDPSRIPKELAHLHLDPQRYAIFTHKKNVAAIGETLDAIWTKWLPNSGFEAADAPCFERYTEEFNPQTGTGGIEVWVPIKS